MVHGLYLLWGLQYKYQFSSVAQLCPILCDPMQLQQARLPCPSPGACSNSCPLNQWCHPTISSLSYPFHPDFNLYQHQGQFFSNKSVLCIRWPKYWSFSFSISALNEYSELIYFRIVWLDFLAAQGTHSLLQHHSSKTSILRHSAFFMVQLSHTYMTTGKIIALTRWTFVGKVVSAFQYAKLVITFLPSNKRLLISWLQSPSAVILEPQKTKPVTVSIVSPSICHKVVGPDTMILVS